MLYPPCAGVRWPNVDTHCAHTLSQSTRSMLTVPVILRSFRTICQSQVVPPSNSPALRKIKHQTGFFQKKCPVTRIHGNKQSMSAGRGVRVCFLKSRWWWLHDHRLAPGGPGSNPPGEPPGTPCSSRPLLCSWVVPACWAEPGELPATCSPPPRSVWWPCASDER